MAGLTRGSRNWASAIAWRDKFRQGNLLARTNMPLGGPPGISINLDGSCLLVYGRLTRAGQQLLPEGVQKWTPARNWMTATMQRNPGLGSANPRRVMTGDHVDCMPKRDDVLAFRGNHQEQGAAQLLAGSR